MRSYRDKDMRCEEGLGDGGEERELEMRKPKQEVGGIIREVRVEMGRQTWRQDRDTLNGKPREQKIREPKGKGRLETERGTRRQMTGS